MWKDTHQNKSRPKKPEEVQEIVWGHELQEYAWYNLNKGTHRDAR
jgi:hypothetical protein